MTAKFKLLVDKLGASVTFKADKTMTYDDFISNIECITAPLELDSNNNLRERPPIVAKLLRGANTSFEIGTLALITDYISDKEREADLNRYFELFDASLAAGNAT